MPLIPPSPRCSCRPSSTPIRGRCSPPAAAASPRSAPLWMFHVSVVEGEALGALQFETDRAQISGTGTRPAPGSLDRRRTPAVRHRRHGAGSDRGAAAPGARAARRAPPASRSGAAWRRAASRRWRSPTSTATRPPSSASSARPRIGRWWASRISGSTRGRRELFRRIAARSSASMPRCARRAEILARNRSGPSALWPHGDLRRSAAGGRRDRGAGASRARRAIDPRRRLLALEAAAGRPGVRQHRAGGGRR